jgi:TM2 domain-containing membrane protein YozV
MKCYIHTDIEAVAFCRNCGKPLCVTCQHLADGSVFCEEHAPAPAPSPAAPQPASQPAMQPGLPSPGLAFVLGLIPGVGAIYNSQYVKGLVHVIVLGTLISLVDSNIIGNLEPLFGMLIALWFFYMAFEAYHTANRRLHGLPVDEFSSLIPLRSPRAGSVAGPIALMLLGGLFLIMTTRPEWLREVFRWWPVALIVGGAYMLVARLRTRSAQDVPQREVFHERQ